MTVTEFFQLPEADPIEVHAPVTGLFGLPGVKSEGEAYLAPWQSPDGKAWWSLEGRTKRQTFKLKDEV